MALESPARDSLLLAVRDLCVELGSEAGPLRLLDCVSLSLRRGDSLGLVGESGSGKTMTALALLRLLPAQARASAGQVLFQGRDLLSLEEPALRALRGDRIAMVFQEPMTALNPVLRAGEQIAEALRAHGRSRRQARRQALELLERMGVTPAAERFAAYPHQLSGGLQQRVMLAMAVACRPDLLIADEPTTALDLTLQAQVLELLADLQRSSGLSLLLVSHDLAVVAQACRQVAVLYAGQLVEDGSTATVLAAPAHPYTAALLRTARALQQARPDRFGCERQPLPELPGQVSSPGSWPPGCRFAPRCPRADAACTAAPVPLEGGEGHRVRCRHPQSGEVP